MVKDPESFYNERVAELSSKIERTRKKSNLISFVRLIVFIFTLVLVYLFSGTSLIGFIISLIAGLTLFLILVRYHLNLSSEIKHLQHLLALSEKEIDGLAHKFEGFAAGHEFVDPEHPYSNDLDIFGRGSLFQVLNRTTSHPGKSELAGWLKNPLAGKAEILERQEAIRELSEKTNWNSEFLATAMDVEEKPEDAGELREWAKKPAEFDKPIIWFWLILIPLISFGTVALMILNLANAALLILPIFAAYSVLARYQKMINEKHRNLGKKSTIIAKYGKLLEKIEQEKFSAPILVNLKEKLKTDGREPSREVRKLSKILNAFDNRLNLIMGIVLNVFLLWDIIQSKRAENWVRQHRDKLPLWIDVIGETDALISLSIFRFNHPQSVFPVISEPGFRLSARSLGHPLIPGKQLVTNPVHIDSFGQLYIITGANMAGKSTYLRTIGVSLVLAMAGSPVMASQFSFSPVKMMTSIRTADSLQKNESYFYAELKRLQRIIETLEAGNPLFILLDEILKGTNSRDKQHGSRGLIKKLMEFPVAGLIATHDLSLGELEKEFPGKIINKSFEVVIKDDQLVFDYLLKEGVAKQMNATFLMKKMGITG